MQHPRQHRLDRVARAAEVHAEVAVPLLVRHVLKKSLPGNACVVHEQCDRPELALAARDHVVHLRAYGNVRLHRDGLAALAAQQRRELVGLVLSLIIVHAHGAAVVRKLICRRAADAAGRACDKRHFFHAAASKKSKNLT